MNGIKYKYNEIIKFNDKHNDNVKILRDYGLVKDIVDMVDNYVNYDLYKIYNFYTNEYGKIFETNIIDKPAIDAMVKFHINYIGLTFKEYISKPLNANITNIKELFINLDRLNFCDDLYILKQIRTLGYDIRMIYPNIYNMKNSINYHNNLVSFMVKQAVEEKILFQISNNKLKIDNLKKDNTKISNLKKDKQKYIIDENNYNGLIKNGFICVGEAYQHKNKLTNFRRFILHSLLPPFNTCGKLSIKKHIKIIKKIHNKQNNVNENNINKYNINNNTIKLISTENLISEHKNLCKKLNIDDKIICIEDPEYAQLWCNINILTKNINN